MPAPPMQRSDRREQPDGKSAELAFVAAGDQREWDEGIGAEGGSLLQSWRWGRFKEQAGWSPLRLVMRGPTDQAATQPLVAAQVLFRAFPRVPLPLSVAYVPRGPVYMPGSNVLEGGEQAFWKSVHRLARRRGAIFLKVEPNIELDEQTTRADVDRKMRTMGFEPSGRLQPARTIVLDICKNDDDLLKAMKPKTRYNIRLAGRRGVAVRRAETLEDLRAFYSLLQITGDRDEFGIHTLPYYEQMWKLFGPEGDSSALVLLAEHPDENERAQGPIAGVLALSFGRVAIYMYGASANRGREHMPTYLLQWEAIRWARSRNCSVYDFWGIPDAPPEESDEATGVGAEAVSPINARSGLRGVYWFKKGFGGREIEYPGAYDYVYNPIGYKLWMRWRGANLG